MSMIENVVVSGNRSTKALNFNHYKELCSHVCIVVRRYKNKCNLDSEQTYNAIEASEFAVLLLENVYKHYVISGCTLDSVINDFESAKDILLNSNKMVSEYGSPDIYLHMWLVNHELDLVERAYQRHHGSYSKGRGFVEIANLLRTKFDELRVSDRYI